MSTDELAGAEASLALDYPTEPKTFCTANRRDKWGHVAHTCTAHEGHEGAHRDFHSGGTWS